MELKYHRGDFVACYLTNTEVYEELLTWGIIVDISPTLEDILVLDKDGNKNWWPARRWRPFAKKDRDLVGILA